MVYKTHLKQSMMEPTKDLMRYGMGNRFERMCTLYEPHFAMVLFSIYEIMYIIL